MLQDIWHVKSKDKEQNTLYVRAKNTKFNQNH